MNESLLSLEEQHCFQTTSTDDDGLFSTAAVSETAITSQTRQKWTRRRAQQNIDSLLYALMCLAALCLIGILFACWVTYDDDYGGIFLFLLIDYTWLPCLLASAMAAYGKHRIEQKQATSADGTTTDDDSKENRSRRDDENRRRFASLFLFSLAILLSLQRILMSSTSMYFSWMHIRSSEPPPTSAVAQLFKVNRVQYLFHSKLNGQR
jgi:hypothetical protein